MRIAIVLMLGAVLAGCGGGSQVPCDQADAGSSCMQVAGTYQGTLTTSEAQNTCQNIVYGAVDATDGSFQAPFTLEQNGSQLLFSFEGAGLAFQAHGTLFADGTAEIEQHLAHVSVTNRGDGSSFDYADDTSVHLGFSQSGQSLVVNGLLSDNLTANEVVPQDSACHLGATLTAHK